VIGTKNQEPGCQDPKKERKRRLTPAGAKNKSKRRQKIKKRKRKDTLFYIEVLYT